MAHEDPTQDIAQKYETKPTIETVLERIAALGDALGTLRTEMREGFARIERTLEDFDVRIDRVESVVNATRSEMLTLRADFREYKREHA